MSNFMTVLADDDVITSRSVGSNLDIVTNADGSKFGVCTIISLLPLSYQLNETYDEVGYGYYWHAITNFLAVQHLNNGDGSIVKELKGLNDTCNIKFGLEFIDTEYDPIVAGNIVLERLGFVNNTMKKQEEAMEFGPCTFLDSTGSFSEVDGTSYVTGIKGYTELSATATQSSLDDKAMNPYFARTIPAIDGGAEPVVDYIVEKLGTKYFALLYVDISEVGSYVRSIRTVVDNRDDIKLQEVIINGNYTSWENIPEVIKQLKELKFNTIFAILPDYFTNGNLTDTLMESAYNELLSSDGKSPTWIFSGEQSIGAIYKNYTKGSTLYSAYRGSGMIITGSLTNDKLSTEIMQLRNSPNAIEQLLLSLPPTNALNKTETSDLFYSDKFWNSFLDVRLLQFQYDATVLSGLAACNAVNNDLFLGITEFYQKIIDTKFEGVSGLISLDSETGSRIPNSTLYTMINLPDLNETQGINTSNGTNETATGFPFEYIVDDTFDGNEWTQYESFVFNDGTTQPPPEIQLWNMENSRVILGSGTVTIVSIFCIVSILCALACGVWTFKFRKTRVVRSSQPFFLYFIICGTILLSLSMIPTIFDLSNADKYGMTVGCNVKMWFLLLGSSVILSSFFSKTHRINKIMRSSTQFKRIKITIWDAIIPMAIVITCNIVLLSIMTWFDPIKYELIPFGPTDRFGRFTSVYGACVYQKKPLYFTLFGVLNGGMLCLCLYQAWDARTLSTEFQETQYILSAVLILGGVLCIGLPVSILSNTNPNVEIFINGAITFAGCIIALFVIFLPKIRFKEKPRIMVSGITVSAISTSSDGGTHGSVNYGEKIITNKTHTELLTEIATLKRRLRLHEQQDVEERGVRTFSGSAINRSE